jgi:FAD/FMN-containing dehydrogenase
MTVDMSPQLAARLRARLSGRVVLPGEPEYDAARQVWNASHDYRPALIARPLSVAGVRAAVGFARERGLPVCVRGGGHNHAGMERAVDALALYQHLSESGGDELFVRAMLVTAPPLPFIPEHLRGRPAVILSAAWFGPPGQAEPALRELRHFSPPDAGPLRPMPYVELQRMLDAAVPRRVRQAVLGGYTGPLSARVIDALTAAAAQPPPMSMIMLQPLGGAVARVSPDATAFRHRHVGHFLDINTIALPENSSAEEEAWAEKVNGSLPAGTILGPNVHAMGRGEPQDRVRAAYGDAVYARLAAVKAACDPGNLFRFNQNIRPEAAGQARPAR